MVDPDLMLEDPEQKEPPRIVTTILRFSAVGITCLLIFNFLSVNFQTTGYERQLKLIKKQRRVLGKIKKTQRDIALIKAIASDAQEKTIPADLTLKKLSTITPDNIVFSEMRLNQQRKNLKLKGTILAEKDKAHGMLSDFIDVLEGTWFFKEANLADIRRDGSEGDKASVFEINCILNI